MSRQAATVSARLGLLVLRHAEEKGARVEDLARAAGVNVTELRRPEARMPLHRELHLWEEAARQTGDPFFGLHVARAYRPGSFDVFDYVCRSASTLRGAIRAVVRYNRLLHDVAEFSLEERGDVAILAHGFRGDLHGPGRQAGEYTFAACVAAARLWTGSDVRPRRVLFMHPAPPDASPLVEFFGTEAVDFGGQRGELELDRATLDLPLQSADPGLCAVLERHADALLSRLPPVDSFVSRVRQLVAAELREGTPTAEAIAARLHMSVRTLHRRLADEGVRFGDEVESLRRGLAERYLGDERLALAEVAFLLGYSEPRAFHRAFKSWTGETPGTWRQRRAQSAS